MPSDDATIKFRHWIASQRMAALQLWRSIKRVRLYLLAGLLAVLAGVYGRLGERIVDAVIPPQLGVEQANHEDRATQPATGASSVRQQTSTDRRESKEILNPALVSEIQTELSRLHLYHGEIDGLAGHGTWAALEEARNKHKTIAAISEESLNQLRLTAYVQVLDPNAELISRLERNMQDYRDRLEAERAAEHSPPRLFLSSIQSFQPGLALMGKAMGDLLRLEILLDCPDTISLLDHFSTSGVDYPTLSASEDDMLRELAYFVNADRACINQLMRRTSDPEIHSILLEVSKDPSNASFARARSHYSAKLIRRAQSLITETSLASTIIIDHDILRRYNQIAYGAMAVTGSEFPIEHLHIIDVSYKPRVKRSLKLIVDVLSNQRNQS